MRLYVDAIPVPHEVSIFDAASYLAVTVLVLSLTALASWVPAKKAASMAPTEALRGE